MAAMSRREFMKRAAVCSGAAAFLAANAAELRANPLGLPIGSQVYPLRSMLKDFPAFVKRMAEIGVKGSSCVRRSVMAPTLRCSRMGKKSGRSWPIRA
jgi:hypothetical protein